MPPISSFQVLNLSIFKPLLHILFIIGFSHFYELCFDLFNRLRWSFILANLENDRVFITEEYVLISIRFFLEKSKVMSWRVVITNTINQIWKKTHWILKGEVFFRVENGISSLSFSTSFHLQPNTSLTLLRLSFCDGLS